MAVTTAIVRSIVTDEVPERSSWKFQTTMKDENGIGIVESDINTLTLTIYVPDAPLAQDDDMTIVNGCDAVDILNTGRGTVGTSNGLLTIIFEADDSEIVNTTKRRETHVALIEVTWQGGQKQVAHEVAWSVVNMGRRT